MEPRKADGLKWLAEWTEIWDELLAAFPGAKVTERSCELYANHLADLPADRVRAAVAQCVAACRFFPTVAEIRERAGEVVAERESVALEAFGFAVKECAAALVEQRVPRLDPIAKEVVAGLGGAWALVYSTNPETTRAHFVNAYTAKEAQERTIANVVPIARRLVPGPAPREIGFRPVPQLAPAPVAAPLSRDEAASFVAEIRRQPVPPKIAPAPGSDAARRMADPEPVASESIDFSRCGACGLEYPGEGRACPRCEFTRQFRGAL